MSSDQRPPTPAWSVVRLLWATARRRAAGRARRQQEIMGRRKKNSDGLSSFGQIFALLVACLIHGALGWFVLQIADSTFLGEPEREGRIILPVDQRQLMIELTAQQETLLAQKRLFDALPHPRWNDRQEVTKVEQARDNTLSRIAGRTAPPERRNKTAAADHQAAVTQQFLKYGVAGFVFRDDSLAGQLAKSREAPMVIVPPLALMLCWWLGMMVSQGEGLELDVQRRRHPMWEWLHSHPIRPAHAFYAELLAPLMANPTYFAAPIFFWVILGKLFGTWLGLVAALLIGLPLAAATSSLNKAIETAALLRLGVRSRGALLGLLSWFGYVAMLLPFFTLQFDGIGRLLARFGAQFTPWVPAWPVRALTFGWGAETALFQVIVSWWIVAAALATLALWTTHRATAQGLQSSTDGTGPIDVKMLAARSWLGGNPLRRKELLWLLRDKGAIVQIVLIPLTIAATQALNFRNILHLTTSTWSALCGLAIICGTYFLLVLGPRSLASEGGALWLALTWPRGLEDLLKAKANLWSRLANLIVGGGLAIACVIFPEAWWKILLVGGGWIIFSSTLALKAVSLVTAPSSSGEAEPPNRSRAWIAMIGTVAFGTGVVTQSWHLAIIGIVFSSLISFAMWQGLRARLPYLFDPWSELPIPAPSLLHATVGIALLVESIGMATGVAFALGGPSSLWLARALSYGLAGALGGVIMHNFLAGRDVRLADLIRWSGPAPRLALPPGLALGVVAGAGLALIAAGYLLLLNFIPAAHEALEQAGKIAVTYEGQKPWIFLLAVGFAPVTEEYFFRGLLFRALDRELGDWRAIVLSAAFFAVFHPPLSWIPVACLGLLNAWLFKYTRNLLPCVACHMAYNAGVLSLS